MGEDRRVGMWVPVRRRRWYEQPTTVATIVVVVLLLAVAVLQLRALSADPVPASPATQVTPAMTTPTSTPG